MKPYVVSIDLEWTDADLARGRVLQIGAVDLFHRHYSVVLPVGTDVVPNEWVESNLRPLLRQAWENAHKAARLPAVEVARGVLVDALRYAALAGLASFVLEGQTRTLQEEGLVRDLNTEKLRAEAPAVFVGYCCGWDFAFLAAEYNHARLQFPFHYELVDVSSLAMGKLDLPWGFSQADLETRLGMEPNPNAHDAVSDAAHQLKFFTLLGGLRAAAKT